MSTITIHPKTSLTDVCVMVRRYGLKLVKDKKVLSFETTPNTRQPTNSVIQVNFPGPDTAA